MHYLAYISAATQEFSESDILSLLDEARQKNRLAGLTGLLMHHEGQFFQILEGPKLAVRECFDRISRDIRHSGVITLLDETAKERMFADWSMAMAGVSAFEEPLRSQLMELLEIKANESAEQMFDNQLVRVFVDTFLSDMHRFARLTSL